MSLFDLFYVFLVVLKMTFTAQAFFQAFPCTVFRSETLYLLPEIYSIFHFSKSQFQIILRGFKNDLTQG